jgi:membrane protease YdiL (CAAX protease family)
MVAASEAIPPEVRAAIDPDGRATDPVAILDKALHDLRKASTPSVELQVLWIAVAVALGQDRRDVIGDLARDPVVLSAHGPVLDELGRLGRGKPAVSFEALGAWVRSLEPTPWLPKALEARHLKSAGKVAEAEAADASARATAEGFVGDQMSMLGLQFGLMLVGVATAVVVPLLRRRRLARGPGLAPSPLDGLGPTTSPFVALYTRRVLLAWIVFSSAFQLALSTALAGAGLAGAALAVVQAATTVVNAVIVALVLSRWGLPADGPRPRLAEALGLSLGPVPGGLRTVLLWVMPAIGFGVVCLQVGGLVSALFLGIPQQFQQSVQLLVENPDPVATAALAVGAVIAAPIAEEALFRGFLYRNLRDTMSPTAALLLSGAIFGLVHMNLGYFLPLAGLGVGLALLYEWSGSLWVPIVAHAAWNAITIASVHMTFHGAA